MLKIYQFSEAIVNSEDKLFFNKKLKKKSDFSVKSYDDLKKYKMGGVGGYYYLEIFKKHNIKFDYSDSLVSAYKKLSLGRIELIPENYFVGKSSIKEHFKGEEDSFGTLDFLFKKTKYHLLASKTYKNADKILKNFNNSLKILKENGTIDSIIKKHQVN